jgi:sporulation protein YlmC with PRC-barrel domain
MFWRMLMTTVAVLALALPAAAQQKAPQQPGQAAGQQEQQAAPAAEGQPADQQPPTAAQQQPLEEPAEAEVAVTPPADMKFLEVQDETQFLADEEVIGKDVVNVMDEEVGTIADLVVDQEKKLVGVVLSVGGFLGVGDKWVAVSVDQIDFPTDEQPARLLVAVTEEQLKNAPDFMTREAVEAEKAAEQAQQQQQQVPPPATTGQ